MLEDIAWVVQHYPEIKAYGEKRNLGFREVIAKSAGIPMLQDGGHEFVVDETSPPISYDEARQLYRRLSKFFAKIGIDDVPESARRERGRKGALKRWGSKEERA